MHTTTLQTPEQRTAQPDVATGDLFGPNDLHLGAPFCIVEAYALMCRELDRKQGMIDDLNQYAADNFGLTPEDCHLLTQAVADRDAFKAALTAMRALFT